MAKSLTKVSGTWKAGKSWFVKVNGSWKKAKSGWVKQNGVWRKFYTLVTGVEYPMMTTSVVPSNVAPGKYSTECFPYDDDPRPFYEAVIWGIHMDQVTAENSNTIGATLTGWYYRLNFIPELNPLDHRGNIIVTNLDTGVSLVLTKQDDYLWAAAVDNSGGNGAANPYEDWIRGPENIRNDRYSFAKA